MAWWQPLKGVLTRHAADWQVDRLAYTSGSVNGSGVNQQCVTLWNNASPSAYFYVYGLFFSQANTVDYFIGLPVQKQPPQLLNTSYAVIGDQGAAPGQVYIGPAPAGDLIHQPFYFYNNGGIMTGPLLSSFPLFVIQPNSGWALYPSGGNCNYTVTYWYVWK